VVSFTPRPLYPQGKSPWYPLDRRLGGPQSRSGRGGLGKNFQLSPGIEPQNTDQPVCSPALHRLSCHGAKDRLRTPKNFGDIRLVSFQPCLVIVAVVKSFCVCKLIRCLATVANVCVCVCVCVELLPNQNGIHDEIKSRLNSGNACYYSVQNLLSSRLISKNIKIKI
jgi:hypothetical protein